MERRVRIWELVIKAIESISEDSKYSQVGLKQIFSFISDIPNPKLYSIDIKTININEIFAALTENSDCVELFQFDFSTNEDIFFSLRDTPEKSIQKAKRMKQYGINQILTRTSTNSSKVCATKINENYILSPNLFSGHINYPCY